MKMLAVLIFLSGTTVLAARVPVQNMTCRQAQATFASHNRYWKSTGDAIVPITRDNSSGGGATCYKGRSAAPIVEMTRDNPTCVLGYRCDYL